MSGNVRARRDKATGTFVERKAWVLLALISAVMVVFGSQMFFVRPDLQEPIYGSKCCTGKVLADVTPWAVDYMQELARYMGTFTILAGLLSLAVVLVAYRRRERWAWVVLWGLPLLFLVHGAVLGSFPFDYGPLGLTLAGLLVPVRLFFGSGSPAAAGSAGSASAADAFAISTGSVPSLP